MVAYVYREPLLEFRLNINNITRIPEGTTLVHFRVSIVSEFVDMGFMQLYSDDYEAIKSHPFLQILENVIFMQFVFLESD